MSEKMHCIYAHVELLFSPERTRLFRIPGGVRDLSPWREFIHPAFGNKAIDSLCGVVKLANPLQVKMLFKELCKTHRLEPGRQFKLAGLVTEILDELLSSKRINNSLDRKIAEATVFIREHLSSNLDVKSLAKKFGLSSSYFRLLFRQTHRTAPVAFHRELRINEACNLMINEGLNVSETANSMGFSNIQNFSRAFKDVMRISPKKFCSGINVETKKRSPALSQGSLNSN
jgi:AraC-like DNA-binding protein